MSYLQFMSDSHLLKCLNELYQTYLECQQSVNLSKFYENKVDPIKFRFDMQFNSIAIEEYIKLEISRKHDKTINNAIGNFHQNLFNGIAGFEAPPLSGYDIRKTDNTIYAELKNKHNTMNSSSQEATFLKLQNLANKYPNSTCYLVEIIASQSQNILWEPTCSGKHYSHPRVRRISSDKFYELATGRPNAFKELCDALPVATRDLLSSIATSSQPKIDENKVYKQLKRNADINNNSVIDQIFKDTFSGFNGF